MLCPSTFDVIKKTHPLLHTNLWANNYFDCDDPFLSTWNLSTFPFMSRRNVNVTSLSLTIPFNVNVSPGGYWLAITSPTRDAQDRGWMTHTHTHTHEPTTTTLTQEWSPSVQGVMQRPMSASNFPFTRSWSGDNLGFVSLETLGWIVTLVKY